MRPQTRTGKRWWLVFALLATLRAQDASALPRSTIHLLHSSASTQYKKSGSMSAYTIMIVGGKAFASTRGRVGDLPHVAIWELNGGHWQFVFEHDQPPTDAQAVNRMYRNYGFTANHQMRLLKGWKPWP